MQKRSLNAGRLDSGVEVISYDFLTENRRTQNCSLICSYLYLKSHSQKTQHLYYKHLPGNEVSGIITVYMKHQTVTVNFIPVANLTLNLLTTTIVAPPSNASKWQMGFKSAFKGLMHKFLYSCNVTVLYMFRAVLCSSSGGQIVCI